MEVTCHLIVLLHLMAVMANHPTFSSEVLVDENSLHSDMFLTTPNNKVQLVSLFLIQCIQLKLRSNVLVIQA